MCFEINGIMGIGVAFKRKSVLLSYEKNITNTRTCFLFFVFFLTALLAFYSVTIVINEKLHVHSYEGKKKNKIKN